MSEIFIYSRYSLSDKANEKLMEYRTNRDKFVNSYLNLIMSDIEDKILKESRINGKSQLDYDVTNLPIGLITDTEINFERFVEYEVKYLVNMIITWLSHEGISAKPKFLNSQSLKSKIIISWIPIVDKEVSQSLKGMLLHAIPDFMPKKSQN